MALTKFVATPYRLKYVYTTSGTTTFDIPQGQLISDAVAGPLQSYFAAIADDAAWGMVALTPDGTISVHAIAISQLPSFNEVAFSFVAASPGVRVLRLSSQNDVNVRFSIVYEHSMIR
jgi:hypothetical protein